LNNEYQIKTIFFGGGTPTALPLELFEKICSAIFDNFDIDLGYEWTLEANPNSLVHNLKYYNDLGINRLSIGVQSFSDRDLKFLTRIHNSKEAINTIHKAYNLGFENINIDLIFNLPTHNIRTIKKNLEIATNLPIKHISYYSLILENGTQLYYQVLNNQIKLKSEANDLKYYRFIIDFLSEKGFNQYEVSNFAKEGYKCRHNLTYWHYDEYLGLGPSAHSFIKNKRWWNYRNIRYYIQNIQKYSNAVKSSEILSTEQMLDEFLMLSFRSDGLNLNKLPEINGLNEKITNIKPKLNNFLKNNLMKFENNIYKLTSDGYAVADKIIEILL
jgi:oxygen-independent coproporphyrinogen-3 oxidase